MLYAGGDPVPFTDRQLRAWLRSLVACALVLALLAGSVRAQQDVPVETDLLLVRRNGDERVVARLKVELEQSAWQTIEIGPSEERQDAELGALGRARGARAALRVDASGSGIELWVASGAGDAQDSVEVLTAPGGDDRVLALRAVEALRARGLLVASVPTAPARPGEPAASKPQAERPAKPAQSGGAAAAGAEAARQATADQARRKADADADAEHEDEDQDEAETEPEPEPALPPPPPPLLALELLPGLSLSAGGLAPALGGALGVRLSLTDAFAVEALGFAPLWSERLQGTAAEGSARVSPFVFAGGVQWAIVRAPLEVALIADAGALLLHTSGEARAPLESDSDSVFAAAGLLGASLRIPLAAAVRLSARAQVGLTSARITVRLGTRDAAQFGAPFALFGLGLDVSLLDRN